MLDNSKIRAIISLCQQKNKSSVLSLSKKVAPGGELLLFNRDPERYMNGLRGDGGAILRLIISHRNLKFNRMCNEYVARRVGCSVRTVQRWTSRFADDGLVFKSRRDVWAPNDYEVKMSRHGSFMSWYTKQSEKAQELFNNSAGSMKQYKIKRGLIKYRQESVTPSYNYSNINNIFINNNPSYERARARGVCQITKKLEKAKEFTSRRALFKEMRMLSKKQALWIHENRRHPKIKDILMGEKVAPYLYTPLVRRVQDLLDFSDQDCLKLAIYPEEAVEYGYNIAHNLKKCGQSVRVKSVVGWFLSILSRYCEENRLFYDKSLYFDLCRIFNLDSNISKEIDKPFISLSFGDKKQAQEEARCTFRRKRMLERQKEDERRRKEDIKKINAIPASAYKDTLHKVESSNLPGWLKECTRTFVENNVEGRS